MGPAIKPSLHFGGFHYYGIIADGLRHDNPGKRRYGLPEPPLILEAHQTLIVPGKGGVNPGVGSHDVAATGGCSNSKPPTRVWIKDPTTPKPESYSQIGFLTQLGLLCAAAQVRDCSNKECNEMRKAMDQTAPECQWTAFRNWALTALSCREQLERNGDTLPHMHITNAIHGCYSLLENTKDEALLFQPIHDGCPSPTQELFDVANIIYWMANILAFKGLGVASLKRWDHHYIPKVASLPSIEKASKKVPGLKLCKHRFWRFVNLASRKQSDLPDLVDALVRRHERLQHKDHDSCAASRCDASHQNSTKLPQIHKCEAEMDATCEQRQYPVDDVVEAFERGKGTAWSCEDLRNPKLAETDDPYIAISHVWSDGTGVGLKAKGTVNSCLFDFFGRIARSLDCKGIWWDALCIPLEPKARSDALGQMHRNYQNAKYTVVHDLYLLNIPFTDAATACLALVLSPWFTRCWTALELFMSKKVKILFKGSDPNKPDLKDLDDEILAKHPGTSSRAHWLATLLILRIRRATIEYVGDILTILHGRSTSWVRDRTVVAALLADVPRCDMGGPEYKITQDIMKHLGAVPHSSLLHGKPTMQDTGPFSWCPATLDDMPIDLCEDLDEREARKERIVRIDANGAVVGKWHIEVVTEKQIRNRKLEPHGEEVSVVVHFYNALLHWENCFVLRERAEDDLEVPGLLVAAVKIDQADGVPVIDCRYVGAVRVAEDDKAEGEENESGAAEDADTAEQRHLACEAMIRIGAGNDRSDTDTDARRILRRWLSDHPKPVVENGQQTTNGAGGKTFIEHVKKAAKKSQILNWCVLSPPKKAWYQATGVQRYIPPLQDQDEDHAGDNQREENKAGGGGGGGGGRGPAPKAGKNDELLLEALSSGKNAETIIRFMIQKRKDINPWVESRLGFAQWTLLASQYWAHGELLGQSEEDDDGFVAKAKAACEAALGKLPDATAWEEQGTLSAVRKLAYICSKFQDHLGDAFRLYDKLIGNCPDETFEKRGIKFQAIGELTCLLLGQNDIATVSQAINCYQRGLQRFSHQLPSSIPALAYDNQHALGLLPRLQQQDEAKPHRNIAEDAYLTAFRVFSRDVGKFDAISLLTAHNLAREWLHQGAIVEGQELLRAVLHGYQQAFGPDHILTLRATLDLTQICLAQQREARARELSAELLQRCEANLGRTHWITRQAAVVAATLLRMRGRMDEAEKMLRRAQDGSAERGSPEYDVVMRATIELGTLRANTNANTNTGQGGTHADGREWASKRSSNAFKDHPIPGNTSTSSSFRTRSSNFGSMKDTSGFDNMRDPRSFMNDTGAFGMNKPGIFTMNESSSFGTMRDGIQSSFNKGFSNEFARGFSDFPGNSPQPWMDGLSGTGHQGLGGGVNVDSPFQQFSAFKSHAMRQGNSSSSSAVRKSYTRDGATVIEVKEVSTDSGEPVVSETRSVHYVKDGNPAAAADFNWSAFPNFPRGF
ncbi:putative kinesin light chain [Rosellinia necatrix]|uniref:Putative kinesin light chain n=1 Tax=Rosellinia necatrix TaxID=77044 RepID=A0A1S7ULV6_ROSNE|nr:putative kinesin light chain [Rosellinia necatrix]